jgi:hypothetical protein
MTENDRKLITLAWQCFKAVPVVEHTALKQKGGYKTAASATACYLAVRKKVLGGAAGEASSTAATTPTPTKKAGGTKRKFGRKAKAEMEGNVEEPAVKKVKTEKGYDDEEGEMEASSQKDGEKSEAGLAQTEVEDEDVKNGEVEGAGRSEAITNTSKTVKNEESAAGLVVEKHEVEADNLVEEDDDIDGDSLVGENLLEGAAEYLAKHDDASDNDV